MSNSEDIYVCTDCVLSFSGSECPLCGEKYGGFFTKLYRSNTFAVAIWARENNIERILMYDGNVDAKRLFRLMLKVFYYIGL